MSAPREYAQDLPYGLVACRLDGEQAHILGLSPRLLDLRTPEELVQGGRLELSFYRPELGDYESYCIERYEIREVRYENGAVLTRFDFDDPDCAARIRRVLNDFARYVEIRGADCASAYAQALTGYPLEEEARFPASPEAQRRQWFSSLAPLPKPSARVELCAALNCRKLWEGYLERPSEAFFSFYARQFDLPADFFPRPAPQRIYVGNEYCRFIFPDRFLLNDLVSKARREDVGVTLVTAELRTGGEEAADRLLAFAAEQGLEVEINDWGLLQRALRFPDLTLNLGPRLNRRRKDPRIQWKAGFAARKALFSENALNDPRWRNLLREMGVTRFEYESCSLPIHPPEDTPRSLRLPFYQTNTSMWCPLQAICTRGARGAQRPAEACARWCEENMLLYPSHLKMLGRWNSLLALDTDIASIPDGFDRWVFNF